MKALYLVLAACFFLGLPSGAETAAQQRPAWHRWAIIASQDLQADGLPDLLTAELSRLGGLELVERERLDLAAKELEVAACFGSAAAGQRLRLGQWLKADGLLLLSIEQREQKKYVKVVISDCVYGARLRVETWRIRPTAAPNWQSGSRACCTRPASNLPAASAASSPSRPSSRGT